MRTVRWIPLALLAACSHGPSVEPGEPNKRTREATDAGTSPTAATPATPPVAEPPDQSAITPATPPANVKIMVRTSPPKAWVYWGRKKLGLTPLNFERPRDSGPVDLVLRASGFFPVHTRAYTVKNDLIGVKMVKLTDRMTIFGAKQELPPEGTTLDPLDPANAMKPPVAPSPTTPAPIPAPIPTPPPAPPPTP
jgi:hypothetical protein